MLNHAPLNQGQHAIASSLHRLRGTDNLRFNNEKMVYFLEILLGPRAEPGQNQGRINVDYMRVAIESMSII